MLATSIAHLRYALAIQGGRPVPPGVVSHLIRAAGRTCAVRGGRSGADAASLALGGGAAPSWPGTELAETLTWAAQHSPFHRDRLAGIEVGRTVDAATLALVPLTTATELADAGEDMLAATDNLALCTQTTGTTGAPKRVWYSRAELDAMVVGTGIASGVSGQVRAGDVAQVSTGARATLGNGVFARACTELGAMVVATGQIDVDAALGSLVARGRRLAPTVLLAWSSYLGQLVTAGERAGLGAGDFALRQVIVGSEIVTAGLRSRARALFGDDVVVHEAFGSTECAPIAGGACEQGHLHFDPTTGHVELLDLDHDRPAAPGAPARLVSTPFVPYRRVMPVLRYDPGDIVATFAEPPTCTLAAMPGVQQFLGKRDLAVETTHGWVWPRQVLEAVESVPGLPLPARCAMTTRGGDPSIVVAVESPSPELATAIEVALCGHGVHGAAVQVVGSPADLVGALPMRCDLRDAVAIDAGPARSWGRAAAPASPMATGGPR